MYEQDEEDYNDALDAYNKFVEYAEKMFEDGINPFTGEKYND